MGTLLAVGLNGKLVGRNKGDFDAGEESISSSDPIMATGVINPWGKSNKQF